VPLPEPLPPPSTRPDATRDLRAIIRDTTANREAPPPGNIGSSAAAVRAGPEHGADVITVRDGRIAEKLTYGTP
jgi:hypothetical protein